MAVDNKVRQPEIRCNIKGERRHVTTVRMSLAVNQIPSVSVTHHIDKEASKGAVEVMSSDVVQDMAARQQLMFEERTSENGEIQVRDGNGGSITYKGFISSPNYMFSSASVNMSDTLLNKVALLDNLNMSGYEAGSAIDDYVELAYQGEPIPEYIVKCYNAIVKMWQSSRGALAKNVSDASLKSQQEIHTINEKVKDIFFEILNSSTDTFGWEDAAQYAGKEYALARYIMRVLRMNSGGFITTVVKLASGFQCLYVPEWEKPGKLVNRNKLFEDPQELSLPVVTLGVEAGNRGMFPTRYVGIEKNFNGLSLNAYTTHSPYLATWPKTPQQGGTAIRDTGPEWFDGRMFTMPPDKIKPVDKLGNPMEKGWKTHASKYFGKGKETQRKKNDFLTEWARSVYIWESLGPSRVDVAIPLDVSVQIGKRYKVKNILGQTLMEAFLAGVEHTVNVDTQGGSCQTHLSFSHVELTGFSLPYKN